MNPEAFEQLEQMTNQEHLLPKDVPVQVQGIKTGNSWVDQNWQKTVAWLWQMRAKHGQAKFSADSLHRLLGHPPSDRDINRLLTQLKTRCLIAPTDQIKHSSRGKSAYHRRLRVWRIV